MTIEQHITRQGGHPWDGMERPAFDLLEFQTEDKAECDHFVERAMRKFWQPWLIGVSEDQTMFGGLLYKPSGIDSPWNDSPECPHPGGQKS